MDRGMKVSEAIKSRRSVRQYRDEPVARELIKQILEAARWAPSAKNVQPWRFLVVEGRVKNQLAETLGQVAEQMIKDTDPEQRALGYGTRMSAGVILQAPVLITVWNAAHVSKGEATLLQDANSSRLLSWSVRIQSIAAAIQNMLLTAHSIGLGGLWICDLNHAATQVKEYLSVEDDLVAGVAIGYPKKVPAPLKRYALTELVAWVGDIPEDRLWNTVVKDMNRNEFLSRVCAKLRERRPRISSNFEIRAERVDGVPFINLWFRTRGCRHDHLGGCTMCNYGASASVSAKEMIDHVRQGIASLDENEGMMLLVSPSGSMFDEWEVPGKAREGIFQLVQNAKCSTVICETRADTVTEDHIERYAGLFGDKKTCIEMGLESADPWILKYCINKSLSLDDYKRAILLLRRYQVTSLTNVMLGCAFLSVREAVQDAVQSVRWAFSQGTDQCVVFPAHVKRWTLLQWLWERGLYSPPSLWSLVEVLARLGPQLAPRVTISWYKNYQQEVEKSIPIESRTYLCSPSTCAICQPKVMEMLDVYRDTRDFGVVQELAAFECECKDEWQSSLDEDAPMPLKERVARLYEAIGLDVLGVEWWTRNGNLVLEDVLT